ncbi:rod shape-determining protein MreC [Lujinxingia litoralis]|uniref:Cell shape-determining protein MreC n=1 Tax=Lujinxingia litoralis TaxID=2211119 RepID=A0A328C8L6_9DELT|nr:rod shape-determining protein MreC [Lujinxingia litoralis]RAL23502.1 rod shape-determining protein MreC [Lujinxingia litoralis]
MLALLEQHRRKIVALVLLVVPLVMIATSAGASLGDEKSAPARFAAVPMGWTQSKIAAVIGVGGFWSGWGQADVVEENERLREEVAQLREENTRLIGVLQENGRLRELVGFQARRPEHQLVPARVIGRDITPYFRVLKVQISSEAELKPRMPVVSAQGVVGQIHQVFEGYADVVLVSDPRSSIDTVSQRNRAQGVVEGLGHERDYLARVSYLSEGDELQTGDVMVTSGMGGIFPRELIVGTISEVSESRRGLFQEVIVTPAVDFSRLEEVFVITGAE